MTDVVGDLSTVESFTVLVEGDAMTFVPSPAGSFDFPLPHLRDHLRSGEPVLVTFVTVENVREATGLADG